jgi:hypothetical protein
MKLSFVWIFLTTVVVRAFEGDGTFYGAGGNGAQGACMLQPGFNGVATTVAMNHEQFEGGAACGRCVRVLGSGSGAGSGMTPIVGPIYAVVDNECPECRHGDVDMGLGGDGRWRIAWEYVSCDEARGNGRRGLRGSPPSIEEQQAWLAMLQKK